MVEGALRNPGLADDGVHRRPVVAAAREQLAGGFDEEGPGAGEVARSRVHHTDRRFVTYPKRKATSSLLLAEPPVARPRLNVLRIAGGRQARAPGKAPGAPAEWLRSGAGSRAARIRRSG